MGRIGRFRPAVMALAGVLGLAAIAAGCSTGSRSDETDRIARTVGTAISHPRQDSAAGYARAALATGAGRDGRLRVVGMEELPARELVDPLARLVFRVHLDEEEAGFTRIPAVTACYEASFNHYGIIGTPRRIGCPPGATPITPPPEEPRPQVAIPAGADRLVERVLARAPRAPRAEEVGAAVREALGEAARGQAVPPAQVATDGADIGVSLFEPASRACLLGARVDGRVLVWRPSRVQLQPGELSCDPGTALARQGMRSPH